MHDLGLESFVPGMIIGGLLLIATGFSERLRRVVLPFYVIVLMTSYLTWRFLYTLDGPGIVLGDRVFIWLFFLIECLGFLDAMLLLFLLTRWVDRSAEADTHARRLATQSREQLAAVDIFIPTYNEPLDVLKRTIFAASQVDWPNVKIWVLDDGRREWLRAFCKRHGIGYLTRPDNKGAKAGNINAALTRTSSPFIAIFDADFAPRRDFFKRMMGFFDDPKVGIVQAAHTFFNADPAQSNLRLFRQAPDEQRFFFEVIMPARDAWDLAFCCGSNSIIRRSALNEIGGQLPEGSITEDIHLTLVLLRKGYITRYLGEPLAYGLAPETTRAFFIQRERWARGAIQLMYLRTGPFGPNLSLLQRLTFLPTYWLIMPLVQAMVYLAPIIFLWTGFTPIANVGVKEVVEWQIPVLIGIMGAFTVIGKGRYHFFVNMVINAFMAARLLPSVCAAVFSPFSGAFRVTPKGSASSPAKEDRYIVNLSSVFIVFLMGGVLINMVPDLRIVSVEALIPVVASWAVINSTILTFVAMVATERPAMRREERFLMPHEHVEVILESDERYIFRLIDLSPVGMGLTGEAPVKPGDIVRVRCAGLRELQARVARQHGSNIGLDFINVDEYVERDIIQKIFRESLGPSVSRMATPGLFRTMISRIWTS